MPRLTQPHEKELNQREKEVLQLIAFSLTDREITKRLHISSIKNIMQSIYDKLDTRKQVPAVLIAISRGLILQPPYPKQQ